MSRRRCPDARSTPELEQALAEFASIFWRAALAEIEHSMDEEEHADQGLECTILESDGEDVMGESAPGGSKRES